jgi:arabinofuranosyltransferase
MVCVSAGFIALGGEESILVLAKLWGLALGAATLVTTYLASRRMFGAGLLAALPPLVLALNPAFGINTVSGLETSTFTFLLTLAFLFAIGGSRRRDAALVLTLAAASLTRPEGFFHFGVLVFFHALFRVPVRRFVRMAVIFTAVVTPYLIWKVGYYGDLLPNTFYAKPVTIGAGARYLTDFVVGGGYTQTAAVPLLLFSLGLIVPGPSQRWRIAFLASHFSAITIAGGDWMLGWRMVVPALPVILLTIGCGVSALVGWFTRTAGVAAAVSLGLTAVVALALLHPREELATHCLHASQGQREGRLYIGHWLRENSQPGDAVALTDIGMIGYVSKLRVIDISGLTDRHIGRAPGPMLRKIYDTAYVLDQQPRFVVLVWGSLEPAGRVWAPRRETLWFQDRRIFENPAFAKNYAYAFSRFVRTEGFLSLYAKRSP